MWCSLPSQDDGGTGIKADEASALPSSNHDLIMSSTLRTRTSLQTFDSRIRCRLCKQLFLNSAALKSHIHEFHAYSKDAFPFVCNICQKGFFSQRGLTHHSEKHMSKFKCHLCPKSYSYSTNLKRHQELTHCIKECRYCKRLFNIGEEFNQHVYSCAFHY